MNIIFGQLVGQFADYFRDTSTTSRGEFERLLDKQALYILALFIGRWGLNSVNKFCFRFISIRLSSAIRLHYLQSLFAQSIHVIDFMPAGAPATAITTTSNTLQLGISERLGTFLQFNGTIWAAVVIAFTWNWRLTLVVSSLLVYVLVVMSLALPVVVKGYTKTVEADAQGTAVASEALEGIRLVMACGAQGHIIDQYSRWVLEAKNQAHKIAPVVGAQFGLLVRLDYHAPALQNSQLMVAVFGIFGAFGLAFWYGIQQYMSGAIDSPGVVIIVLMSVMMILTSMERVSTPLMAVSKAMVAACEFFNVIDAPLPASGTLKLDTASLDLVFDDVTFEYPSRPGAKVLDSLAIRIRSGQNTALVGPSGSGKSTIVGLLERWYSLKGQHILPQVVEAKKPETPNDEKADESASGAEPVIPVLSRTVKVGDHDLEELDLRWWRSQIGLEGTVRGLRGAIWLWKNDRDFPLGAVLRAKPRDNPMQWRQCERPRRL